jgi:hypothetical protein
VGAASIDSLQVLILQPHTWQSTAPDWCRPNSRDNSEVAPGATALTVSPVPSTAIAELSTTTTRHVQTSVSPLHHCTTGRTRLPSHNCCQSTHLLGRCISYTPAARMAGSPTVSTRLCSTVAPSSIRPMVVRRRDERSAGWIGAVRRVRRRLLQDHELISRYELV